jgi:glycosyltransferase involved in cell wall biosynthesis
MNEPKVSFVCSVRNGEKHIKKCAFSVLQQTIENIELLFIDDHSTDSTWDIMQSMQKQDQRVKTIKNENKEGLTNALNLGLDHAKGEYVARIDVDDFTHSRRVQLQIHALEKNTNSAMATSCFRVVDEEDYEIYTHCPCDVPARMKWLLCFRNTIGHSTTMWRKSLQLRYDPMFKYSQDYELWCRISKIGDIVVVPEILTTIKKSKYSITEKSFEEQEYFANLVCQQQYEYYVGESIDYNESKNLRMIHYLKNQKQNESLNKMNNLEFKKAIKNYCNLFECFKNNVEEKNIHSEIKNDIENLLANPTKSKETKIAFEEANFELINIFIDN